MKPAAFDYARPASLDEACAMLAADDDVRIIAGGQTLVPLMAMRLARPTRLIDIARIAELAFVREEGDAVAIGATTRQCVLERDPRSWRQGAAARQGHAVRRPRADPGARHDRRLARQCRSGGGDRAGGGHARRDARYREGSATADIPASEFFIGPMMTALPAAGCLTAVRFPVWREARIGIGFHEISARRSDFAFASAAAQIALDDDGSCRRARASASARSRRLRCGSMRSAKALDGTPRRRRRGARGGRAALAEIEPLSDLHASADYRRRVAVTLAVRAIADAYASERRGAHAR